MSRTRWNSGFSLVSVAVLLVVAGLIIGSMVSMFGRRVRGELALEAKRSLRQARSEIVGFVADRCQLPSANPADPGYYLNHVGHRLGRFRETAQYEPAPALAGLSGPSLANFTGSTNLRLEIPGIQTKDDLAFVLWTGGENHADEFGLTRTVNGTVVTYTLNPYAKGRNDDMVDYVVFEELKSRISSCE